MEIQSVEALAPVKSPHARLKFYLTLYLKISLDFPQKTHRLETHEWLQKIMTGQILIEFHESGVTTNESYVVNYPAIAMYLAHRKYITHTHNLNFSLVNEFL